MIKTRIVIVIPEDATVATIVFPDESAEDEFMLEVGVSMNEDSKVSEADGSEDIWLEDSK